VDKDCFYPSGTFDLEFVGNKNLSDPTDLRTICSALEHFFLPAALCSINDGIYLQRFGWMNLASFYHLLPYFSRQAVLASRYSKGWFNQSTDSVTFEPSDLIPLRRYGRISFWHSPYRNGIPLGRSPCLAIGINIVAVAS
jgi:hypothetical protein